MARISESVVSLRIMGDRLIPSVITSVLGGVASFEQTKGQEIVSNNSDGKRMAQTGMWCLEAKNTSPENLDMQIAEIFSQLTTDLDKWKILNKKYRIDLFCGLFMKEDNEGLEMSPASLKLLSERGVVLGLDIYGSTEDT